MINRMTRQGSGFGWCAWKRGVARSLGGLVAAAGVVAASVASPGALAQPGDEKPELKEPEAQPPATPRRAGSPPAGVNVPSYAMFNKPLPMIIRSTIREATGRLDKLAFDPATYRVFLSGTKSNVVFVLDLATHKTPHIIQNVPEARDVIWQAEHGRLIVACGGDGTVRTFKATVDEKLPNSPTYTPEHKVQLSGEATDLAFEAAEQGGRLWVAHAMMLSAVDVGEGKRTGRVSLPGRPDGLVCAVTAAGPRVFANVPRPEPTAERTDTTPMVVVVDAAKSEIVDRWLIADARANSAITVSPSGDRVYVVTQDPPKLIVLDSANGKEIARLDAPGDSDDVKFDAELNRLYVIGGGGGGQVAVVQREPAEGESPERYTVLHTEKTNVGCRNAVLAESERLLLVASPAFGTEPTFIYVYMIGPR